MLYMLLKILLGPLLLLILRPIVYGKQNLRVKGKAILNLLWLSPFYLMVVNSLKTKKEIFESKIGNIFFRSLGAFPVNRKNVDLMSLKNALKVLNDGKIFGLFPEGKREVSDSLDEFEKGTAFFAIRSGAPVIPIYIHPDSQRRLRPVIMVGKAIDVSEIAANAQKSTLIDVVTDELADAVAALGTELEEIYCN